MNFEKILNEVCGWVWGAPTMALLIGTGLWMTIILRGLQFRYLFHAFQLILKNDRDKDHPGDISNFQSLMAALSATVGVGNIAGVATAIAMGGPGAMFWMWCTGLVGMATKYAEALLAVHYRVTAPDGTMSGGPMYYISRGLEQKWLAVLFALFTVVASFGIGNMTQSNTIAATLEPMHIPTGVTGLVLAVLTGVVILGGIKSLGRVTAFLVPIMIGFYFVSVMVILVLRLEMIPQAFGLILEGAFTPTAAVGGFAGATVRKTMQIGLARGLFSNEAGLGSGPIVAAAARTRSPVAQALVSMLQTFIDTLVVCSLTGLAILVTDCWKSDLNGVKLTVAAFDSVLGPAGSWVVGISLILFAYSTLIGWGYYGEQALSYLTGFRGIKIYRILFVCMVWVGAVTRLEVVWTFSDVFNGLMALPNLIALLCLTPVILEETRRYAKALAIPS